MAVVLIMGRFSTNFPRWKLFHLNMRTDSILHVTLYLRNIVRSHQYSLIWDSFAGKCWKFVKSGLGPYRFSTFGTCNTWKDWFISNGAFCIIGPLCGESESHFREGNPPATQKFDISFVVSFNKLLNKESNYRWFETPCRPCHVSLSWSYICHCSVTAIRKCAWYLASWPRRRERSVPSWRHGAGRRRWSYGPHHQLKYTQTGG